MKEYIIYRDLRGNLGINNNVVILFSKFVKLFSNFLDRLIIFNINISCVEIIRIVIFNLVEYKIGLLSVD